MKIKKWIAFMAALCMTLGTMAFAACGDKGGNGDSSSESSVENSESSSEEEIPLGAEGNPHWCYYQLDEETGEIIGDSMYMPTVKANSAEYYLITKSGEKIICIGQADVTVVYKGTSYSAKDGAIEIQARSAVAGDINDWAVFQIINETENDIELIMTFKDTETEDGDDTTSDETSDTTSETTSDEVSA